MPVITKMLNQLKNRWNALCGAAVDRQRKLEEALLFSGQFKEALQVTTPNAIQLANVSFTAI